MHLFVRVMLKLEELNIVTSFICHNILLMSSFLFDNTNNYLWPVHLSC